jgi:hypothetical protein
LAVAEQMCDLGQLLDLARRLRLQADETRLPAYAMRFRQAAAELEAFVGAARSAKEPGHAANEDRTALPVPKRLSLTHGRS